MLRMSSRSAACVVALGTKSKHTKRASGLRDLKTCHSFMTAVAPAPRVHPRFVVRDEQHQISFRRALVEPRSSGALQLVPPPPMLGQLLRVGHHRVARVERELRPPAVRTESLPPLRFWRKTAAATSAAPSMHRIDVVAPLRWPVIGLDIDPETSTST